MAEKIVQIMPCQPEVRIAMYDSGNVSLHKPTCLALVERGAIQEVVYLEMVDNTIEQVDTASKLFLGFVEEEDFASISALEQVAQTRYQKEQSVKPK
jgi:hypothetical protein